ncbi:MAG: thiol-disulfide oxidoreductase DCC family protein [Arachidicoccus sp.]|nr:thiol-disulfide oxidoreductase DCC family protein [Arachidicoccus sp.]
MDNGAHDIILFDGVCNLCNGAVQFILRHDKKAIYQFASLQSDFAKNIFNKSGKIPSDELNSILLIRNNKIYQESSAVLHIAQRLNGGWKLLSLFLIVPKFIRDGIYKYIARNRYKWFGRQDACMMPAPELKARFLYI